MQQWSADLAWCYIQRTSLQRAILLAGSLSPKHRILELGAIGDHTSREFTSLVNTQGISVSHLHAAIANRHTTELWLLPAMQPPVLLSRVADSMCAVVT